jgi:peroxiredoxin
MRTIPLLAAALAAAASLGVSGEHSGRRAPGFSLPDTKLQQHDIQDYRGKVVLIDVMKTDCPHCGAAAATLESVRAKYGDRVVVLAVVNPPDTIAAVNAFAATHKLSYPVLFDCGQMAASYLKITPERPKFSVPHLFVIDRNGVIAEDYGYSAANREIFEGKGLFPVLDRLLAAAGRK